MKNTIIIIFLFLNVQLIKSQNLAVGFINPNEVLNLNSGTFSYDTVFLFNNATLNITNQTHFVVNEVIALLGSSNLNVENSYFEVNRLFLTTDTSTAVLKDSLNLPCDLYVSENSSVYIDSATVDIPMTFKSEFGWWSYNNALFEITNSNFNLGSGALEGSCTDSATFNQFNNQYSSTIFPMTIALEGNSNVSIDSCSGGMEFVISENSNVDIQDSYIFMIWYTFADGDTVNYDYPPPNSVLIPASSYVSGSYSFSNSLPNVSGVDFNVDIQNTDGIFWGIISRKNSDIIVNNSTIRACGFYFDGLAIDTAFGFNNSQFYTSYNSTFSDRGFALNNSTVTAWNFYPSDTSEIIIDNSVYGESIGFSNGITKVYNSTCDGTGGYFGGTHNSKTYVYSSQIIRQTGTAQIINFQEDAKAWFYNSDIIGDIVLSHNSQMFIGNTSFSNNPVTNNNAYFAEAWIDSISTVLVGTSVSITGKVWDINGVLNSSKITRYIVGYSNIDSTGFILIKDTTATSFNIFNGQLASWNTQSLSIGNYLLWLTIFVDGDTAISCNRTISLSNNTGLETNFINENTAPYPNPSYGIFTIGGETDIEEVKIYDSKGVLIYEGTSKFIKIKKYRKGIYYVIIKENDGFVTKKIILL